MTAKQYLMQLRKLETKMFEAKARIVQLRIEAASPRGIDYSGDRVQSSTRASAQERYAERIEALESRLKANRTVYTDLLTTISSQIDGLDPELYRDILRLRYIRGLSLSAVAEETGYTYGYIRQAHGEALQEFERRYLL